MLIVGIAGGTGSGKTTVVKKEPSKRYADIIIPGVEKTRSGLRY